MAVMTVIADVRIHENKDENLASAFGLPCTERLRRQGGSRFGATTVMTEGKVVVKGTGAVIDAAIPDRDKKKNREKDKGKNRRPVSDDGLYRVFIRLHRKRAVTMFRKVRDIWIVDGKDGCLLTLQPYKKVV